MYTSFFGKRPGWLKGICFGVALLTALAFSACETGSDPDNTLPLAGPRSIQITARDSTLVLQWTKVAPAQGVIPSYEVYFGTISSPGSAEKWGEVQSNTSQLVTATITGLENHRTYLLCLGKSYICGFGTIGL
ncbi:MAG: fibronectin type III domain-containing protein [Treponema sp.]|jgi:hypothetical protein|nr:fibronectin type III domain-containing protein [Treponema sp.]